MGEKLHYNHQIIVLDTIEGTAQDEAQLEEVWKNRLTKVAPHYEVVGVIIKKGLGKFRV